MDFKTISDSEPQGTYTGHLWVRPGIVGIKSTAAFLKMGGAYVPVATTNIIPFTYARITYLIDGIDKSDICSQLNIDDVLTSEVDTCSFILDDFDGDSKPTIGQEINIFYKETATSEPEIRFAGRISETPQRQVSPGVYAYDVMCVDYTQDLQRKQVVENFTSQSAGAIIKAIVEEYAPGIGTYYVEDGITVNYISFNYVFPMECIEDLAELTGYDWYVDYEKNIHFFEKSTNTAPYQLTESSNVDTEEFRNLEISVDKTQLKNSQIVRGGFYLSDDYTQTWIVQVGQTELPIAYTPNVPDSGALELSIDGGGNITPGIDNIDTTSDYVVNRSEKVLKDQNANWSGGEVVILIYKYKVPVFAKARDNGSIELMKQYEGDDGIYEGELIIDETIKTKAAAAERAEAELAAYSNPVVTGSFGTTKFGYRSGQLLVVDIPTRNVNATYLIQNVTSTHIGGGEFEYEIAFATKLKGLRDYLILLFDRGKKIYEREDDVLETFEVIGDTLTITDATPVGTIRDITVDKYVWSNDTGTTPNKGQWNAAEWQ